jgi:hypothetical protein
LGRPGPPLTYVPEGEAVMSFEHPVAVKKPTLIAEGHFQQAAQMAQVGITKEGLPPHTLAYVLTDIASGLFHLATGVRATYLLLEEVQGMLRRQAMTKG